MYAYIIFKARVGHQAATTLFKTHRSKTIYVSVFFFITMFSINSLTCAFAPPRSLLGSAVTVKPFRDRALLTVEMVSVVLGAH